MTRLLLVLVLCIVVARMFWRVVDGIIEGATGRSRASRSRRPEVPSQGVQMVRDPVCGTFVVPDSALTVVDGRARLYFCSTTCRDRYRSRPAGRPEPPVGRTA
jgi:uncharacterized protein